VRLGGGRARLGFCFLSRFLGGFGPVGIQKLAGHGQRVRGWIEARGKRRVASSSSVIGSGSWIVRAEQSWRRVGTVTGFADLCNRIRKTSLFSDVIISEALSDEKLLFWLFSWNTG